MSYYGSPFVAAVEKGDVLACQFHPELSGHFGLSILKRWIGTESLPTKSTTTNESIAVEEEDKDNAAKQQLLPRAKIPRIVPCLDVRGGKVVKGIKFQNIKEAGDPSERASLYENQGADELVVLDISATIEERKTTTETVSLVRNVLSIPLCVGGGVKTVDDAQRLLLAGADKVAVNTAAVKNPSIINDMALKFGRQCTVLSLDAALKENHSPDEPSNKKEWEVVINAGKERTGMDAITWAKECEQRGAGEILLTSWDRDGTKSGYDVDLIEAISRSVTIPIIASGGAATADHLAQAVQHGADAVLAASIFHYAEYTVQQVKEELQTKGIPVRLF
jgi:imidazoleglycerol phosphate synthase cyclase subunit